jgi:peptidoglycan/xylan/chitin deacetylase (PgdA/CDA1 family)
MQAVREDGPSRIVLAWVLVALAVLITVGSVGLWAYSAFYSSTALSSARSISTRTVQVSPTSSESQQASAATQKYMQAFLARNYGAMWTMLHPQMQAMWPDQAAFTTYLQARFQGYTLQSFTVGTPSQLDYWINPETMVQHDKVVRIPVSLKLVSQQQTTSTPENLHPELLFQNLPFIIQRSSASNGKGYQWLVLASGPSDLEAPILPPLAPVQKTVSVPILMYHHISLPLTQSPLDQSLAVNPEMFKAHLQYLKEQGFHSITFNQLFDALYYDAPLPKKPIILTFDDGYDDAYKNAYPMLKAQGFSGMFYIITGKVGWQGQATWPQLQEMLRNGMQMGSHTVNHLDMGQVLQASESQAQQELQVSQSTMQKNLGIPIQQFCYPSGEPFRHYSLALQQEIVRLLTQDGYVGATTDPGGQVPAGITQSSMSPLVLLRLRVDGRATFQDFVSTVSV